jgi:hypothetical protein
MAIFGLEHSTFDPKGGSLSGGEKAQYELRLGRWSERTDLIYSEVGNLPDFANGDAVAFFSAADHHERVNGRRWTEDVLTLASDLNDEQNISVAQQWVWANIGRAHPYILAVHKPERMRSDPVAHELLNNPELTEDQRRKLEQQFFQPHAHVLYSERMLSKDNSGMLAERWFSRVGAKKDRKWNDRELISKLREEWATAVNTALAQHAPDAKRVDHRSLREQRNDVIVRAHRLPENSRERGELEQRAAELDRTPEGRMSWKQRNLEKHDGPTKTGREFRSRIAERRKPARPEALKRAKAEVSRLSQARTTLFSAIEKARKISRALRVAVRELALASDAGTHARKQESIGINQAQKTNGELCRVIEAIERNGSATVRQLDAFRIVDSVYGTRKLTKLHGDGASIAAIKDLENEVRRRGDSLQLSLRGLGHIGISRAVGDAANEEFEYVVAAKLGKAAQFLDLLRESAEKQLKWDTAVLQSRERKLSNRASKPRQQVRGELGRL